MSEQNVEVVRAIYAAWTENRSAAPWIDREMEYVNPPDAVESGTRVGREHIASVRDVYPDFHAEPERFIDAGDEVVVIASVRARTARSDVELRWRQGFVWTIRDGKAVRFQWFNDPKEALAAAGMPEEEG